MRDEGRSSASIKTDLFARTLLNSSGPPRLECFQVGQLGDVIFEGLTVFLGGAENDADEATLLLHLGVHDFAHRVLFQLRYHLPDFQSRLFKIPSELNIHNIFIGLAGLSPGRLNAGELLVEIVVSEQEFFGTEHFADPQNLLDKHILLKLAATSDGPGISGLGRKLLHGDEPVKQVREGSTVRDV